MQKILHIKLKQIDKENAELRYYFDNPNDYKEQTLEVASIQKLIQDAEAYYYVSRLITNPVKIGKQLYQWLDSAERFLTRAIENCQGTANVLVLAISTKGRLGHLPWEVLCNENTFLVQIKNPLIVPVRWKEQNTVKEKIENRALRVLFMACSPIDVKPVLDFEREEGLILKTTERQPLMLIVEESGNLDELKNLIKSYEDKFFDVFHLTGHAGIKDEHPCFLTEDEIGKVYYASAEKIGESLSRMPKLIFLSGCRTGESGKAGVLPSFAEELLDKGAKAVIGWGRPVSDYEASETSSELYGNLATGDDLGTALARTYQSLIKKQASDWHLLRLYIAGEMPDALVTPLKTPHRKFTSIRSSIAFRFLDKKGQVKVINRENFIGRRRSLQRCLKTLRYDNEKIGVVLHGMGGIGKSSLACRLCDRLSDYHRVVFSDQIDKNKFVKTLIEDFSMEKHLRDSLSNPHDELKFILRDVFPYLKIPLLLVMDDFEANFEKDSNFKPKLIDGLPLLSIEAQEVLEALTFAIQKTDELRTENYDIPIHRIIITSRYTFDVKESKFFLHEQLSKMTDADVSKKIARLNKIEKHKKELKDKAIQLSDGNPRLIEWLFQILSQEELDHKKILDEMAKKEIYFRMDILAEELLNQQIPELRKMLGLTLIYELPVPLEAIKAVCKDISDLEKIIHHTLALGLIEVSISSSEKKVYRVSRILEPLLRDDLLENREILYQTAAKILYQIWAKQKWVESKQLIEIHRLALEGKEPEIATNISKLLSAYYLEHSLYKSAEKICLDTLKIDNDNYILLNILARSEHELGKKESAFEHYQKALDNCPNDDPEMEQGILSNFGTFLYYQGNIDNSLRIFKEAMKVNEKIGNERGKTRIMYEIGKIYSRQNKLSDAEELFNQVYLYHRKDHNLKEMAASLHELASIHLRNKNLDKSLDSSLQALKFSQEIRDLQRISALLTQIGQCYFIKGEKEQALTYYYQAVNVADEVGYKQGKAVTLILIADFHIVQGKINEAIEIANESLKLSEEIGDVHGTIGILFKISLYYILMKRFDDAFKYYQKALELQNKTGYYLSVTEELNQFFSDNPFISDKYSSNLEELYNLLESQLSKNDHHNAVITMNEITDLLLYRDKFDEALKIQHKLLISWKKIGDESGMAAALGTIGNLSYRLGKIDEAYYYHNKSLEFNEIKGNVKGKILNLFYLARCCIFKGEIENAAKSLNEAYELSDDKKEKSEVLHEIGVIYSRNGQYDNALQAFFKAIEIEESIGGFKIKSATLYEIGRVFMLQGKMGEALTWFNESLEHNKNVGDTLGIAKTLYNLGGYYSMLNQLEKALYYYHESILIGDIVGDIQAKGMALSMIADIYFKQNNLDDALRFCEESSNIQRDIKEFNELIDTLKTMAKIYAKKEQADKVLEVLKEIFDIFEYLKSPAAELVKEKMQNLQEWIESGNKEQIEMFLQSIEESA